MTTMVTTLCRALGFGLLVGLMTLMAPAPCQAQSDLELAEYYFNEGSYPQARLYLEPLWKKNKTNAVYQMYYGTLLALDDFDAAEKLVKGAAEAQAQEFQVHGLGGPGLVVPALRHA